MFNLNDLKKQRAASADAAQALFAKADGEKRPLTAEETQQFDALEAKVKELDASIERGERALKMGGTQPPPAPGRPPVEVHNNAEDRPFESLGEFLLCVRAAANSPSAIDDRLHKRAALGANEKVGSEGAFLVGKDVSSTMLEDMHDASEIASRCTEIPISANSNSVTMNGVDETSRADGSRWGGVNAYWVDEAEAATKSKPKFRQIELKLKKLLALFYATEEVLQDSATLGAIAQRAFSEEMAFKVDDAIYRGVGSGQPLGFLNSGVVVQVSKEGSQSAATILYENVIKMYARMPARSKSKAAWFIHDDCMPQIMLMTLPGGTSSTPVFLPANGAVSAPFGTLLGRPIIPVEQASTVGTVGDIVFADFSQYLLATKGGLQQAQSIHVQFLTAEQVFRFIYRVDGQPARSAPMTPAKGSNTLSPFVVLQTR